MPQALTSGEIDLPTHTTCSRKTTTWVNVKFGLVGVLGHAGSSDCSGIYSGVGTSYCTKQHIVAKPTACVANRHTPHTSICAKNTRPPKTNSFYDTTQYNTAGSTVTHPRNTTPYGSIGSSSTLVGQTKKHGGPTEAKPTTVCDTR